MYKGFIFVNTFLSPVHVAVQASHAIAELFSSGADGQVFNDVTRWVDKDKTLIILQGGNNAEMKDIERLFVGSCYSAASFREPDMGNAVTAVSVILDDKIWATAAKIRSGEIYLPDFISRKKVHGVYPDRPTPITYEFTLSEVEVVEFMSKTKLYG